MRDAAGEDPFGQLLSKAWYMLGFTTFVATHLDFLVGTDCARPQWFEVGGGTDIKKQGNKYAYLNKLLTYSMDMAAYICICIICIYISLFE